jgi:hypothetical protein
MGFSGEERRRAISEKIADDIWKNIINSRYAAISIDEPSVLAHGPELQVVAQTAAEFGHRFTVVTNPLFNG